MESKAFFEKKLSITPSDFNEVKTTSIDDILLRKAKETVENKCSEQGFVLPGSIQLLSRSMGYFESARFTGDAIYFVKLEGRVVYPVEGVQVIGRVMRKNKMGLYINYQDAIRIQVPRDLHLNEPEFEEVNIGDEVYVELKRSKFAIHDSYILASGLFIRKASESGPAERAATEPVENIGAVGTAPAVDLDVVEDVENEDEDEDEDEEDEDYDDEEDEEGV